MPSRMKRTPQLVTRLADIDNARFQELQKSQKRPAADLLRDAVRHYLDYCDGQVVNARETAIERRLKRIEDRLAALLARIAIDVGWIFSFLYFKSGQDKELSDTCAKRAYARIVNKLDVMSDEYMDLVAQKVFRSDNMVDVQTAIVKQLKEQVLDALHKEGQAESSSKLPEGI